MKDLTKLTFEEANKLECALLMLEKEVRQCIDIYMSVSEDPTFTEKTRNTMRSNAEWWQEVYTMLYD